MSDGEETTLITGTDKSENKQWVLYLIIGIFAFLILLIIGIGIYYYFKPAKPSNISTTKSTIKNKMIDNKSDNLLSTILQSTPMNNVYYVISKENNTLHRLDLSNNIDNLEIRDIVHIKRPNLNNTYLVLNNGNIYGLTRDTQGNVKSGYIETSIPIEKLKIIGDTFLAISNGNLHSSNDLTQWNKINIGDTVEDISVPNDESLLFITGKNKSYVYDTKTDNILKTNKEKRVYGRNRREYITISDNMIKTSTGNLIRNKQNGIYDSEGTLHLLPQDINLNNVKFVGIYGSDDAIIYKGVTNSPIQETIVIPVNRVHEFYR